MGRSYGASMIIGWDEIQGVPLGDQADFLEKMVDTLETGGWIQGSHDSEDGMCIEGAMREVMKQGKAYAVDEFPVVDGQVVPPVLCITGLAATETLRDILGAELGMKKMPVEVAKHTAMFARVESQTVMGWSAEENNPIPAFNDATDTTKAKVIQRLRDAIEEIRAGQGALGGSAPVEVVAVTEPVAV